MQSILNKEKRFFVHIIETFYEKFSFTIYIQRRVFFFRTVFNSSFFLELKIKERNIDQDKKIIIIII